MLTFEYDKVVAFHPYRTHEPYSLPGAVRLLHFNTFNSADPDGGKVAVAALRAVEVQLIRDCKLDLPNVKVWEDNHYGFTVRVDNRFDIERSTYYQIRFSDGTISLWLTPKP